MAAPINNDDHPPPAVSDLLSLYPPANDAARSLHLQRYARLQEKFCALYALPPAFIARAPGRVNLIGEHVDYSGFGVLPMAIERDVVIAVAKDSTSDTIQIANTDERYTPRTIPADPSAIVFQRDPPHWTNYFLAAFKEVLDRCNGIAVPGLKLLVDGNVPPGSGLSSSSALVCASALAIVTVLNIAMSKRDLAGLCAVCERYVGVQSGGMDQAISFLAEAGRAKKIDFDPVRSTDVHLPMDAAFVVVDSLVQHSLQSQIAGASYNIRVVECRLAAVLLAKGMDLDWQSVRRLADVKRLSGSNFELLLEKVESLLKDSPYTTQEIATALGLDASELVKRYIGTAVNVSEFELKKRAKHVFSESSRVDDFAHTCALSQKDTSLNIETLGKLMNASQESCANLFQCSCPELNEVVGTCRASGAVGARLTGAGWGGWAIALVPKEALEGFLERMTAFYRSKGVPEGSVPFIATLPTRGACVLQLS